MDGGRRHSPSYARRTAQYSTVQSCTAPYSCAVHRQAVMFSSVRGLRESRAIPAVGGELPGNRHQQLVASINDVCCI